MLDGFLQDTPWILIDVGWISTRFSSDFRFLIDLRQSFGGFSLDHPILDRLGIELWWIFVRSDEDDKDDEDDEDDEYDDDDEDEGADDASIWPLPISLFPARRYARSD